MQSEWGISKTWRAILNFRRATMIQIVQLINERLSEIVNLHFFNDKKWIITSCGSWNRSTSLIYMCSRSYRTCRHLKRPFKTSYIARPRNLIVSQVVSYKYCIHSGLSGFWLKTQPLSLRYGKCSCFHNLVLSPASSYSTFSFYLETISPLLFTCLLPLALLGHFLEILGFWNPIWISAYCAWGRDTPWGGKWVCPGVVLVKTGKPDVFIYATLNSALGTISRPKNQTDPCGQWARFGLFGPPSSQNRTHLSGSACLLATVILTGSAGSIWNLELCSAIYLFLPASLDPWDSDLTFLLEFIAIRLPALKCQLWFLPGCHRLGCSNETRGIKVT